MPPPFPVLSIPDEISSLILERFTQMCEQPGQLFVPEPAERFNPKFPGSFHIHPEIFLPQQGVTCFDCPRDSFRLGPGQMCIVPTGVSHLELADTPSDGFHTLVLGFSVVSKQLLLFQCSCRDLNQVVYSFQTNAYQLEEFEACLQLIEWAAEAARQQQNRWRPLLEAALLMLIDALEHPVQFNRHYSLLVTRVIQQISNQLSESRLSVQSLADSLNISTGHLSRVFRAEMGTTLQDYLLTQRLTVAKQLLEEGQLDVNEVAYACGYQYPSYFVRFFKQKTGMTPGEWRNTPSRRNAL